MCRDDEHCLFLNAMIENRRGQGASLLRIRSRANLIDQNERRIIGIIDDVFESHHLRRKCTQIMFNGLMITDCAEERFRTCATFPKRKDTRQCHCNIESDTFQRNCFTTGIRTRNEMSQNAQIKLNR